MHPLRRNDARVECDREFLLVEILPYKKKQQEREEMPPTPNQQIQAGSQIISPVALLLVCTDSSVIAKIDFILVVPSFKDGDEQTVTGHKEIPILLTSS